MKDDMLQKSQKKTIILISFFSLLGGLFLLTCTNFNGVGMSPDSAQYIAAAKSLVEGKGFLDITGKPIVSWPPFFSVLMAFFHFLGMDYLSVFSLINVLSFIIIIFTSSMWLLKISNSAVVATINALLVIFAKPLFHVHSNAWSEPFFIAEICIFMLVLGYCKEEFDWRLILLAIVTSIATLTRYPGVVLVPIGCFYIFFKIKGTYIGKIVRASLWGFVTSIPLLIWIMRNYLLTKTFTGERLEASLTLSHNLELTGKAINYWFLPLYPAQLLSGWFVFILLLFLILSFGLFLAYKFFIYKKKPFDFSLTCQILFIFLYGYMIISSCTKIVLSPLSDRYLSPLFIPLLSIFMYFLYISMRMKTNIGKNQKEPSCQFVSIIIIALFLGVWLSSEANIVIAQAYSSYHQGFDGYNKSSFRNSQAFAWVKEMKLKGKFFSNESPPFFIWTYYECEVSPQKYMKEGGTPETTRKINENSIKNLLDSFKENEHVYLVWHLPNIRKNFYEPDELRSFCNMKLLAEFSDGLVYELFSLENLN
ncbi:MAG: hypothetical protein A2Y10_07695 [Planctomycetes bacterium GWF2_41_51]|nr:MAG: hypothetical protein A2Y10_07695 [Planctomycetes bacterium GWF2_41_51]HBG26853.1 hypothetical protein [Phycisphaerales bacterium]